MFPFLFQRLISPIMRVKTFTGQHHEKHVKNQRYANQFKLDLFVVLLSFVSHRSAARPSTATPRPSCPGSPPLTRPRRRGGSTPPPSRCCRRTSSTTPRQCSTRSSTGRSWRTTTGRSPVCPRRYFVTIYFIFMGNQKHFDFFAKRFSIKADHFTKKLIGKLFSKNKIGKHIFFSALLKQTGFSF